MSTEKQIPLAKGHWLFGSLKEMNKDILGFLTKQRSQLGDIFHVDVMIFKIIVITKPDYIRHVLQENNKNYVKSFSYEVLKLFLGNGLLTSEGDFWRKQRRLAQPAFHKEKLIEITRQMSRSAEAMAVKLEEVKQKGNEIDITEYMNEVTLDIVAAALFSSNVDDKMETIRHSLTVANEFAISRIQHPINWPLWMPVKANRDFRNAARELDKVIYNFIESRRKLKQHPNDLLSMLMDAVDEETGERMSDLQLRDECMTIFLAGHETTSLSLSWFWLLMHQHPEEEQKLHDELKTVLNGRTPGFADIPRLKYTKQLIEESMRLYPPAWTVGRKSLEADEIDGYKISPGQNMMLLTYAVHRHPDYWDEPDKFKPERFSDENVKNIKKFAYFPFGGGPRLCIGNSFAMMEMQIVIATLAQRFKFCRTETHEVEKDALITMRPKGGIKMKVVAV
ncbi:MAG: putative cytochrome P450 [Bacteroidia bacterium]|nr:putative cytochrome P450 [Bacteroidia bacterium]